MDASNSIVAPPHDHARAFALFAAVAVLTATWLALNLLVPSLQPSGIPFTVVRLAIHAAILGGIWLGLARTAFEYRQRLAIWLALAVPFTVWLIAIWILAFGGAFIPRPGVPSVPLAIFAPVIVGLVVLLRSKRVAALLDATPPAWLVALQVYRAFGGIFLVDWARGSLSSVFALPAGIGDMVVGLLALPVAYYLHNGAPYGRRLALAWNILGLLDLAIAITIGILSAPGPLQLLPPDRPNTQLGTFPTVMIPTFVVPCSILLHALSIRQLRRMGRRETRFV
jgi:hypothetical protein